MNTSTAPQVKSTEAGERAAACIAQFANETGAYDEEAASGRLKAIAAEQEAAADGTWTPSTEELHWAAKVAWRNSNRCIGRLHWRSLHLFDRRDIRTAGDAYEALIAHLRFATNGGRIRSTISVFSDRIRILNPQLIRFAGFRHADGSITGDPMLADFTDFALRLGWEPARRGPFEFLPLILQAEGEAPRVFELPDDPDVALRVPIRHPELDFEPLGLQWHALPVISNMDLAFGGLRFRTAPFNGYYMGTEIGARNLSDVNRYNKLPEIARLMGLDTRRDRSLWRDRALVELNLAVLHSFEQAGVKMVDHHTASEQYLQFEALEARQERETTGDWAWLVPPVSGSVSPLFHKEVRNVIKTPNYLMRDEAYPDFQRTEGTGCPFKRG
ncbi:nitric-oxide synthase [Cyclonatronum proteinivorum]|uniref:Nitric oxide synthase oxygenase n=1 Tax=Cyclonatronum proteinivorum TaxID=1457365 RepID=A0A345UP34_9BACT|nr:nitric oxide synthase oxygenase [Cyclonatronum proteinivorum]AXJ02236.1 nitric-oxide synthase [Cyclonatronum proteinivorum]